MTLAPSNPPQPLAQLPLGDIIDRLLRGEALLLDGPQAVVEVVGVLHSYGIVLDAYSRNLIYIADNTFLQLFPFFKYFNGQISLGKWLKHLWHDRINYEYAEYCMKSMFWHGGGALDHFVDSPEFRRLARTAIAAKIKSNPLIQGIDRAFPEFLLEQVRQLAYYSALGQFWRIMSDIFMDLSAAYDHGQITQIPDVVTLIQDGLVAAAATPVTYGVEIGGQRYDILPASANLTFLMDTAVPYVEAVFFRGTPFPGTISYNAQAGQVPVAQERFSYGALYADPLPIGGAGIPPTLLMQDMRHFIPPYLHEIYEAGLRHEDDLLVKICVSFQKSMFCVTTAAISGLAPHPLTSTVPEERSANVAYLTGWMERLSHSQIRAANGQQP
ncbi:MAG: CO2 hydration protein [Cyanobacteria bacterium]|nr:CO2 hydration protein [Cyanobacteriota bacterium]